MCGIAGCVSFHNPVMDSEKQAVQIMTRHLSHRGPDHEGFLTGDNFAFGHRRLAIIDLDRLSNQPMTDMNGEIILIFNGEIYNHLEIRKTLEKEYPFKTNHSDTETIIYAYKKWGIDFVNKLNGMFAIAIYDKRSQELFLIRDRLGKKPLYYVRTNNSVFFSSEIRPFFHANILNKKVNESSVYHYLTFLTTPAPNTFFENVFKLEAGHYLHLFKNTLKKKCYWDISTFINNPQNETFEDASIKTEDLLKKAIIYRNVSDVPVTAALSGGIDSSINLFYSKKINASIDAVNIRYSHSSQYDESSIAKRFAKELGVNLHSLTINDDDIKKTISEFLEVQNDMPFGDPNSFLLFYISKQLKLINRKVMLVGEGGDEIGGYPIYIQLHREYNRIQNKYYFFSLLKKFLPARFAKRYDVFYDKAVISKRHIHGFHECEKKYFWLGNKEINSYEILSSYMSEIRSDLPDSFLRKILNIEYKMRLPELILARIDYPTMAASIEARSPFMDHKLIEYSATLDFNIKMKYGAKTLLKNIVKQNLPDYISGQPKIGFGMLLQPFYKKVLPLWFKEILIYSAPINEYISHRFIKELYAMNEKRHYYGNKLWIIYALNKWLTSNNI